MWRWFSYLVAIVSYVASCRILSPSAFVVGRASCVCIYSSSFSHGAIFGYSSGLSLGCCGRFHVFIVVWACNMNGFLNHFDHTLFERSYPKIVS